MNKVEVLGDLQQSALALKEIKDIVNDVLNVFKIENSRVEIIYSNEEEIRHLNKEHRQTDMATDVLSFPQITGLLKNQKLLGSVVISTQQVREKNENEREVIKHGILHLLGYDHEDNQHKWNLAAQKIKCKL